MNKKLKTWLVSPFVNVYQSGRKTNESVVVSALTNTYPLLLSAVAGSLVGTYVSLLGRGKLPIENSGTAAVLGTLIITAVMVLVHIIRARIVKKRRAKEQEGE